MSSKEKEFLRNNDIISLTCLKEILMQKRGINFRNFDRDGRIIKQQK